MTIEPLYHWRFVNFRRTGNQIKDFRGRQANLHKAGIHSHGQIDAAIRLNDEHSHVDFGPAAGQFGTKNFTFAFGINIIKADDKKRGTILGNLRTTFKKAKKFPRVVITTVHHSEGGFLTLRLHEEERLAFLVGESFDHPNRISAVTPKIIKEGIWYHVALVRAGAILRIYVDGELQAEASSSLNRITSALDDIDTGFFGRLASRTVENVSSEQVAEINNRNSLRFGSHGIGTPEALYEDLRIYDRALTEQQIKNLVPPTNRVLRPGEVELIAPSSRTRVVRRAGRSSLQRFSRDFGQLRLGPDTAATLYEEGDFQGVVQRVYSDVPDLKLTRLKTPPAAIDVWSSIGEPFTGQWAIAAPNGQFLSHEKLVLTTARNVGEDELFILRHSPGAARSALIPGSSPHVPALRVGAEATVLTVDDAESAPDAFSIVHPLQTRWLQLEGGDTFRWTKEREDRAVFRRAAKNAADETQVGELAAGEVALYRSIGYRGRTWILSDRDPEDRGNFTDLRRFHGLNDSVSSLRLGPNTGVTVFANRGQGTSAENRETEVEDFLKDVVDLRSEQVQIGNDTISALKIFRTVAADTIFAKVTSKLSQDYRLVGDALEEFSAYRTILHLGADVSEVEVSATDLTTIEVDDTRHEIDEERSVKLQPNQLKQIMIASEADGISTPALKFRTSAMGENEFVVIAPDEEAHRQIAALEGDALWEAKDAKGELIVDREAHSQSDVASVQNTIKRVMATAVAPAEPADARPGTARAASRRGPSGVARTAKVVAGKAPSDPWTLNFAAPSRAPAVARSGGVEPSKRVETIWEQPLSEDDFAERLARAAGSDATDGAARAPGAIGQPAALRSARFLGPVGDFIGDAADFAGDAFGAVGDTFEDLVDEVGGALRDATSVALGFAAGAFNAVVDIGGRLVRFVLDTARKVAAFVQAVVDKVVKSIKQFIEFLQFLFDWGDFLVTQRFIVEAVNRALDSAGDLVTAAKAPVSEFIDELRETIGDGIDSLIRALGGDPAARDDDGFELPEAAEWLLNKIFGGSKSSETQGPSAEPGSAGAAEPATAFEQALLRFSSALQHVGGIAAETFDGLMETIDTLIKNPTRPELLLVELLEAFKEISREVLGFAEDLILGMLDLVVAVIDLLKDFLNVEIRIPFISQLFGLIGAGKLSLLNLGALLVAVPATVVSKLLFGETPLPDFEFPEMPKEAEVARAASPTPLLQASVAAPEPSIDVDGTLRRIRWFGAIAITADAINGVVTTALDAIPEKTSPKAGTPAPSEGSEGKGTPAGLAILEGMSLVLSFASWLGSFPSSDAEPGGYPYNLLLEKNRPNNRQRRLERGLWGYRTTVLAMDILVFGAGFLNQRLEKPFPFPFPPTERMRRGNAITMPIYAILSTVDLVLVVIYLSGEEDSGTELSAEIIAAVPRIACPLRILNPANPVGLAAYAFLFVMNSTVTITSLAAGIKLLNAEVGDLQELQEQQRLV